MRVPEEWPSRRGSDPPAIQNPAYRPTGASTVVNSTPAGIRRGFLRFRCSRTDIRCAPAVSYTHLDVYKRQRQRGVCDILAAINPSLIRGCYATAATSLVMQP